MKNVYCISNKQRRGMKSSISWSKNSTISQAVCAGAGWCKSYAIAISVQKWLFLAFFLWLQW